MAAPAKGLFASLAAAVARSRVPDAGGRAVVRLPDWCQACAHTLPVPHDGRGKRAPLRRLWVSSLLQGRRPCSVSSSAPPAVVAASTAASLPLLIRLGSEPGLRHYTPPGQPGSSSSEGTGSLQQEQQQGDQRTLAQQLAEPANLLSLGRAATGPLIASLIWHGNWPLAVPLLAASGATDWLDGYVARRLKQESVLGSYLDPAADKVLICCVVGALAAKSLLPAWVAAVVIGRDVALVVGMLAHRAKAFGWRWPGATCFFQTADLPALQQPSAAAEQQHKPGAGGVPYMKPLLVSKVNTFLQLALVGGCMTRAWWAVPDAAVLSALEGLTAATTALSCFGYFYMYIAGTHVLLRPPQAAQTGASRGRQPP